MGTIQSTVFDRTIVKGNLAAGAGATFVYDYLIPTNRAVRLNVEILGCTVAAGNLGSTVHLVTKAVFANSNNVVSMPTALIASTNPKTANGLGTSEAEVTDSGGEPTTTYAVGGASNQYGRLTITNVAGGGAFDLEIIIDSCTWYSA